MTGTGSEVWKENPEWQGGTVRSKGMRRLVAPWLATIIWNGMAAMIVVAMLGDSAEWPLTLRFLLFAFIAMGPLLLAGALTQTARVARFGGLTLDLDPFPGSIGGHVGGSVDVPIRPGGGWSARATLHCIHSYMSGSGENRSRREDVVWSAEVVPEMERSGTGTRLRFVFDVPDRAQPQSEIADGDRNYWTVHLAGELPGADLDQSFVVPVYRVDPPRTASRPFEAPRSDGRDPVAPGVVIEPAPGGIRLRYRRGRYGGTPYGLLVFGAICVASGIFVTTQAAGGFGAFGLAFGSIFLVTFGLVGGLLILMALGMLLNSLTVEIADGRIRTSRSYVIFRRRREAAIDEILRIEAKVNMQSGQGSTAKTAYEVRGVLPRGSIPLGDGIRGARAMERIRTLLEERTGMEVEVEVALRRRLRSKAEKANKSDPA